MVGIYMQAPSMTLEQYKTIDDKLKQAVGGLPKGLKLHTCFREGDGLAIYDVWESVEDFEAMGPTLMPIAAELGIEFSPPQIAEIIAYEVS